MRKKLNFNKILHNEYYSGLLKNLFVGGESETTCFLQFFYFTHILSDCKNEYADMFYKIATDDLEHHSILAECIVKLGGDPMYINKLGMWLNGRNLDYIKNVEQMINLAIELKEKMIIEYKIAVSKISDKDIKNILEVILMEEEMHKDILLICLQKNKENN